ncbi:MAG: HIT family protein [Lautropia sp.]|nr:HIT family protein [Lautropia sp.]
MSRPACPLCHPVAERLLHSDERLRIIRVEDEPGQHAYFRVIWQGHLAEMTDLADADRQYLWQVLTVLEQGMRRFLSPDKINLASFGNQVPHLHWHVIGRWADDPQFPGSAWSARQRRADSVALQQIATRVEAAMPSLRHWLEGELAALVQR